MSKKLSELKQTDLTSFAERLITVAKAEYRLELNMDNAYDLADTLNCTGEIDNIVRGLCFQDGATPRIEAALYGYFRESLFRSISCCERCNDYFLDADSASHNCGAADAYEDDEREAV